MRKTLEAVHDAYTHALKVNYGLDISKKLDIRLDLARLRYLPPYDYIWWDAVEDFQTEAEQEAGYYSMYGDLIEACKQMNTDIPEGSSAQKAYTSYASKAKTMTDNTFVMLKYLPELGLTEKARKDIISWTEKSIQTKAKEEIPINLYQQPIDIEALPLPFKALPKVMQVMLKRYPATWQRSSFFCTLPAFSTACGGLTQENGKPLVFQVALYGEHQTGKTEFSAKPATIIQDYIARNDNERRYEIRKAADNKDTDEKKLSAPLVIPFINTSQPQVMKYLRYAKKQTIMAYEGDILAQSTGKDCAFLNLKSLLRCGFDGETVIMDYKAADSFQGSVKARLSALVVGTPTSIFNYFNPQSTAEGNSRRVIFVQHEGIMKPLNIKRFTEDELQFIHNELDKLQCLGEQTIYHEKIEHAASCWRAKKQQLANKDEILHRATHTPTEMFKRTAYLMWALFDFNEKKIKNCCEIAQMVAEYQYRQYINLTYAEQKEEKKKW